MRKPRSHGGPDQQGAVLVEMALILPILLFFFVGIVDFGLILREYQILQNAAREGARISILKQFQKAQSANPTTTENAIKQRVVDYLAQEQITVAPSDVQVNQGTAVDAGGISVWTSTITVTYNRPLLIGNGWPFGPVALKGEAIYPNFY